MRWSHHITFLDTEIFLTIILDLTNWSVQEFYLAEEMYISADHRGSMVFTKHALFGIYGIYTTCSPVHIILCVFLLFSQGCFNVCGFFKFWLLNTLLCMNYTTVCIWSWHNAVCYYFLTEMNLYQIWYWDRLMAPTWMSCCNIINNESLFN